MYLLYAAKTFKPATAVQDDSEDGDDNIDEESFAPVQEVVNSGLVLEDIAGNFIISLILIFCSLIHFISP